MQQISLLPKWLCMGHISDLSVVPMVVLRLSRPSYRYGMAHSPRGWNKLFRSVCIDFGFTQLKSDECVFVKIVPNTKSQRATNNFSAVLDSLLISPNLPKTAPKQPKIRPN